MLRSTVSLAAALLLAGSTIHCSGIGAAPDATMESPNHGNVGKVMNHNSVKFEACGRDSVTVQTGAAQTMNLRFVIDAEGHVQKSSIENMTAPDPDLQGCVLNVLRRLKFPPPKDGKPKDIIYPVTVKSEN